MTKVRQRQKWHRCALNIDNVQKSLAKVMNHRIEKLSMLRDANESQLNVQKTNGITIKREKAINETSDNISCSSNIKADLFLMNRNLINET
jgi:hypothetical protein